VIFVPVAFMSGQVGRYFYSFGIVSAVAFMISMFVSFTLTPALCATWLRPTDAGGHGKSSKSRGFYAAVDRIYGHMLGWSLHHRFVMVLIALAVTASAAMLFPRVGKELVPDDDQSEFSVNVRLPRGTSLDRTNEYLADIEQELRALPEVQTVYTSIQSAWGNFYVGMTPLEGRKLSQQDLMRMARMKMRRYSAARIRVSGGTDLSGASTGGGRGGRGNSLYLLIQGPDIEQLRIYTTELMKKIKTIRGVVDVDTNYEPTQPELRVNIDRTRAADLGVNIDSLASSLRGPAAGSRRQSARCARQ
jgi:HAE1 family hydrophobic/amphiphilic exporter-1